MSDSETTQFPETIPIFPLIGVLLLPGGRLPLHIFESRYRAMTEDALASDGMIGMIQPLEGAPAAEDEEPAANPSLYQIGCLGRIFRWERLPDGRYILILEGLCRFRIREELASRRGYRRVAADFREFLDDQQEPEGELDTAEVLRALGTFGSAYNLELDTEKLAELGGVAVLNSLAMALPFQPAEKQALLEAADVRARLDVLLSLLEMGVELSGSDELRTHEAN